MDSARILVVDDHADLRALIAGVLSGAGHLVDTSSDGEEAMAKLAETAYDLVIADLIMPRLDGMGLLKRVKELYPETDVMIVTGHATIETAVKATRLGARDYFTKPFDVDDLQLKIRNWAMRKTLERETRHLNAVVSLTELSRALVGTLDLESLIAQIVTLVESTFAPDYGSLVLVQRSDQGGLVAQSQASFGETASPFWADSQVLEEVIASRKPLFKPPVSVDSHDITEVWEVSLPLCNRDGASGVLNLARGPERAPYREEDLQLLGIFGAQIAIALDNANAYRELKELNISTITALVRAMEARDQYTRGHSERVATYAIATAEEIGLARGAVEDLRVAGLLHDIGKIGVPDPILNKKSILTDDEYEVIKEHPLIGAAIVQGIKPLQQIVPLIYHHHERMDGSGYPDGLSGDDIPLGARILAVADAFEAMTSRRVYRATLSPEDSLRVLEEADSQFDPDLVSALKSVWSSGKLGHVLKEGTRRTKESGDSDEAVR